MKPLQMQEVYKTGKRYEDISLEEMPPEDSEIDRVEYDIYFYLDDLFGDVRNNSRSGKKLEDVLNKINAFVSLVNEQQGVK